MNTSNSNYSATARNATRLRWLSRLFLFLTVIMLQAVAYGTGMEDGSSKAVEAEEAVKLLPPATTADNANTPAQDETQKALLSGKSRCSQDKNHSNRARTESPGRAGTESPGHANNHSESTAARDRGAVRSWLTKHKCALSTIAGAGTAAVALSTIVLISQYAGVSLNQPPAKSPAKSKASALKTLVSDQMPFNSTTNSTTEATTELSTTNSTTELSATEVSTRPATTTAPPPWWENTYFPACAGEAAGRQPPITTTLAEETHTSSHQTGSPAADSDEINKIVQEINQGYSLNNGDFLSNKIIPILDTNIRQANSLLNQAKALHSALSAIRPAYGIYNYEIINDIQLNNKQTIRWDIDLAARVTPPDQQLHPTWAESHKVIQKQISDLASAQYTADRQYITLLKGVNNLKDAIKVLPEQMKYELSADEDDKISKSYINFFYVDFFNDWNSIAKNITQDLESLEGNKLFNTNYLDTLQFKYSEHFRKYSKLFDDFYDAKNALHGDNSTLDSWGLMISSEILQPKSTTPSSLATYLKCNPEDFLKRYAVFISNRIRENGEFTGKNYLKLMASHDNNQVIVEQASDTKNLLTYPSNLFYGYCFSVRNSVDDDYFTHWGKIRYIDISAKDETGTFVFIDPMAYGSLLLTKHSETQLRLYYHPNDIPDYSRYKNRVLSYAHVEHSQDSPSISYPLLYKTEDGWQLFVKIKTLEQVENTNSSPTKRNKRGLADLFRKKNDKIKDIPQDKIKHIPQNEIQTKQFVVDDKVVNVNVRKNPGSRALVQSTVGIESYNEMRAWAKQNRINIDIPKDKIIGARASSAGDIAGSSSRTFAYEVAQGEFKSRPKSSNSIVNPNGRTKIVVQESGGTSYSLVNNGQQFKAPGHYDLAHNGQQFKAPGHYDLAHNGQQFKAPGSANGQASGSANSRYSFVQTPDQTGRANKLPIGNRRPEPLPKPAKAAQWGGDMGASSRPHYESIKIKSAIYESIDESKLLPKQPSGQLSPPKQQGPTFVLSQAEQKRLLSLSQSRSPAGLGKKPAVLPKPDKKNLEARCRRGTGSLCSMSKKGQYNERLMPRKLLTRQDTVRFTQTMPQRTGVERLPNDVRSIKKPVKIVAYKDDTFGIKLKIGSQIKDNMNAQGFGPWAKKLPQAKIMVEKLLMVNKKNTPTLLEKIDKSWSQSTSMKANLKNRKIVKPLSAQKSKAFAYISKLKQVKKLQIMSKARNVQNLATQKLKKASIAAGKLKGGIAFAAFDMILRGISIGYRIAYHNSLSEDEQEILKERFFIDMASAIAGGPFETIVGLVDVLKNCPKNGCNARTNAEEKNKELIKNAKTAYTSALKDSKGMTDVFNVITKTLSGPPVSFVQAIFKNGINTFNLYAMPVELTGDAEDRFVPYISLGDISRQQLFIVTSVDGNRETISHVGLGGDIATLLMDKFYGVGIKAAKEYRTAEEYAREYIYDSAYTEEQIYEKIKNNGAALWAEKQCSSCTGFKKTKTHNDRLTQEELQKNAKLIYKEHAKKIKSYLEDLYSLDKMNMLGSMHSTFLQTMQLNIGQMTNRISYPPIDYESFSNGLQAGDSSALKSNQDKVQGMVRKVNNDYNKHCLGLTRIFMDALIDNREWFNHQDKKALLWGYDLNKQSDKKELMKKFRYPKIVITPKIIQPGRTEREEIVTDIEYGKITANTNTEILNIIQEKHNSIRTSTNENKKNIVVTFLKSPKLSPSNGRTPENTSNDNILIRQRKKVSLDEFIKITSSSMDKALWQMQINEAIQSSSLNFAEGYAFTENNKIYKHLNLLSFPIVQSTENTASHTHTVDLSEATRYGCYITQHDKVAVELPFCEDGQDERINLNNAQMTFNIDNNDSNPVNVTNLIIVKYNSCHLPLKEIISEASITQPNNDKFKVLGINRYGSYSIKDTSNNRILASFQVIKEVSQPREKSSSDNPNSEFFATTDNNYYNHTCPSHYILGELVSDDFHPGSFKYTKYRCKNGWCKPYALGDFKNFESVEVDDESDIGIPEEKFLPHLCDVLDNSTMPGTAGSRFQPYIRHNIRMAMSHYLKLPIYNEDGKIIDEAAKDLLIELIPESLEEGITEEATLSVFSDDTIEQLFAEEDNSGDNSGDNKKTVRRSVRSSGSLTRSKETDEESFASSSTSSAAPSSAPDRMLIGAAAAAALLSTGAAAAASDYDKEDDDDGSGEFHWNSFKATGLKALYFSRHGSDEELEQKRLIVQNWVLHRGSDMAAVNRAVSEEAALVYQNADLLEKPSRHPVNSRDSSVHHTCLNNAHDLGYAIADNKDIQVHIEDEKQLPDFLQADITRQSIRDILMHFDMDAPVKDFLELLHTISEFSLTEESNGEERSFLVGQSPWFAILDRIASFDWYEKNIAEGVYKQQPTGSVMGRLTRMAYWLLPSFVFENHNNCASINHVLNRIADSFPEMTIADLCQARLDNIMNSDASHTRDPGETIRKKLASLRVLFDIEKFLDSEIIVPKIIMDENHIALKERCGQVADPGYRIRLLSRQTTKGDATVLLEKMPGGH